MRAFVSVDTFDVCVVVVDVGALGGCGGKSLERKMIWEKFCSV